MLRPLPDFGLLAGETVTVLRYPVERDGVGEPVYGEPEKTTVEGVLVQTGITSDMEAARPDGVTVAYTLHFPKTYAESLRGCSVVVRGEQFDVVGDPHPHSPENVPGPWNYTVEVEASDG